MKISPKIKQNLIVLLGVSAGFIGLIALIFSFFASLAEQQKEQLLGKTEELITKTEIANSNNQCLFLARGGYLDINYVDTVKIPLFNDLSTGTGISTFILPSNGKFIEAYLLQSEDNNLWTAISFPIGYKVIEENGEIILSFEDNVLYRYIHKRHILVILMPQNLLQRVKFLPFTNGKVINLNSPKIYHAKLSKNGISSGFNELTRVKDVGEKISPALNQVINDNVQMGQLIVPSIKPVEQNILPPIVNHMSEAYFFDNFEQIVCPNFINLFAE